MNIKIEKVDRKDGRVKEVKVLFDGRLELNFAEVNGEIKEISRMNYGSTRSYERESQFIPKETYGRMMGQVRAIFTENRSK